MNFNTELELINNILKDDLTKVNNLILLKMQNKVELIPTIGNYLIKSGGKRIRPLLTLLCSKVFNYQGNSDILLSACIEFIHSATLLHDDIVDDNTSRRGFTTSNVIWGNKSCILVGDYLFSKAFELMVEANNLEILAVLSKASSTIAQGEIMQLSNLNNLNLSLQDYTDTIFAKTASLFSASTKMGSLLTEQSSFIKECIENYGINLGMSFQIFDDILDYSSTKQKLGKEIGTDMKEGKITLPIILSLQECNNTEKDFLNDVFCNLNIKEDTLQKVIDLITKYDAFTKSCSIAQTYADKAVDNINDISIDNNIFKEKLICLAKSSIKRTS